MGISDGIIGEMWALRVYLVCPGCVGQGSASGYNLKYLIYINEVLPIVWELSPCVREPEGIQVSVQYM